MAKKEIPPEFANEYFYERHKDDLERNLAALQSRLVELESLNVDDEMLDGARADVEGAKAALAHYGWGPKQATTRPKKATETR